MEWVRFCVMEGQQSACHIQREENPILITNLEEVRIWPGCVEDVSSLCTCFHITNSPPLMSGTAFPNLLGAQVLLCL